MNVATSVERVATDDGWLLALQRYHGRDIDLPPVLLCGGYACNRHFLDFDDRHSLARYLARRGFETWVVELRGRGSSRQVNPRRSITWTFDDLVRHDVPAAVRHVRREWSHRRPVWIGHSMGGMLAYAALGQQADTRDALGGLVTLASPVIVGSEPSRLSHMIGGGLLAVSSRAGRMPQRRVLIGLWSLLRHSGALLEVGMNPANVDRQAFGAALSRFICDVPPAKLRQFVRWAQTREFSSLEGVDYRANLARVTTPTLVIAGARDRIATPASVRLGHGLLPAGHKAYLEFGTAHGHGADYGHIDLVFGRHAPEEVFATVASWIGDGLPER